MSHELDPVIWGVGAWSASCLLRYSTKTFLRRETFKRINKNPSNLAEGVKSNIIDTNFLKKLAPLAIGVLGIIAGLTSFSLGNDQTGFFLTSFGAAHLTEGITYYQHLRHLKPK